MNTRHFMELAQARWKTRHLAGVGLDPKINRMPASILMASDYSIERALTVFILRVVDATAQHASFFKPNLCCYQRFGSEGMSALRAIVEHINRRYPHIPVILDAKYGDIGKSNADYASAAFEYIGADAVTIIPYAGMEAFGPFLELENKGVIAICRTSNKGSDEFQELMLQSGRRLYEQVAHDLAYKWNTRHNCAVVVGATFTEQLGVVRSIVGDLPILIPGIGDQDGERKQALLKGVNPQKAGIWINSAGGIIHASEGDDFEEAAAQAMLDLHAATLEHLPK